MNELTKFRRFISGLLLVFTRGYEAIQILSSTIYSAYYELESVFIHYLRQTDMVFYTCVQDNMKLMDDIVTLRPTIFCSVPRLYNRIYAG